MLGLLQSRDDPDVCLRPLQYYFAFIIVNLAINIDFSCLSQPWSILFATTSLMRRLSYLVINYSRFSIFGPFHYLCDVL